MQDHVTKPIEPDTLYAAIARYYRSTAEVLSPPEPTMEAPLGELLPRVAGLDTASGLKRTANNAGLYRKILGQYLESEADAAERIRVALAAGRSEEAERAAHTAKGVSGNIGALTVRERAADLEAAIRAGESRQALEGRIIAFELELSALIDALRPALGKSVQNVPPRPCGDPARGRALLEKLVALLAGSDPEAGDFFEKNRDELSAVIAAVDLDTVYRVITDFDFEQAELICRRSLS